MTNLSVTVLGTVGGPPTEHRISSSIQLKRGGKRYLFEAPEGVQRRLRRYTRGVRVNQIFISEFASDNVLGLPGLLETNDFEGRENPLNIHIPSGGRNDLKQLVGIVEPDFPVSINAVTDGEAVVEEDEYHIEAFGKSEREHSVGYALVEAERRGEFDEEKAEEELGIPEGPKRGELTSGNAIQHDGRTIEPEQVLGPQRPGRTVVYTGDIRTSESLQDIAKGADLLVHDASGTEEQVEEIHRTGHSTAEDAAALATSTGVKRLALIHYWGRFASATDDLRAAAQDSFGGELYVPDDGDSYDIDYPNNDDRHTDGGNTEVGHTPQRSGFAPGSEPEKDGLDEEKRVESVSGTEDETGETGTDSDTAGTRVENTTEEIRVSQTFRDEIFERYEHRCVLTGIEENSLLTLSHILDRAEYPKYAEDPENVLILNWLHHKAFDDGLFTLDQQLRLRVHPEFDPATEFLHSTIVAREGDRVEFPPDASVSKCHLEKWNEQLEWWLPEPE